jgi:hypothetical protein
MTQSSAPKKPLTQRAETGSSLLGRSLKDRHLEMIANRQQGWAGIGVLYVE